MDPQFYTMSARRLGKPPEVKAFDTHTRTASIDGHLGSRWPSCIGPGQSHGPLLVSEAVVRDISQAHLSGALASPVGIEVHSKKQPPEPAPRYYSLTATGTIKAFRRIYKREMNSLSVLGDVLNDDDELLHKVRNAPREFVVRWIPQYDTWDGKEFFNTQHERMFGEICCNHAVVLLAKKHGWTNISFTPFDSIKRQYEDFRNLAWPPALWYPPDQPPE
jgi:hypothetical protein